MRRAFEAVATALGRLAQAAADLCARARHPLTPDELEACAAIGRSMRRLLDRAAALVEFGRGAAGERRRPSGLPGRRA